MNKKLIGYMVLMVVAGLLGYNSVYFKKLDAKKKTAAVTSASIAPAAFAQQFFTKTLSPYMDSAMEINNFIQLLQADAKGTVAKYSKTQGIGNTAYFLVKGEGVVTAMNDDLVTVAAKSGENITNVKLNTGVYFGNAVRDVTGKISMGDFTNTMDFNTVSSTLNKIVQTTVILPFKTKAAKGAVIQFVACAEINKEQIQVDSIELVPVKISL
jgi:predicted lipoprotein